MAFLWGQRDTGKLNGTLLKLPAGFAGKIKSDASEFHAMVIKGEVALSGASENALTSGS